MSGIKNLIKDKYPGRLLGSLEYFSQHFFGKVIYDMAKISWSFEGICQIFESAWPKVKVWHLNIFFLHRNLVQLTAAQTIRVGLFISLKGDLRLDKNWGFALAGASMETFLWRNFFQGFSKLTQNEKNWYLLIFSFGLIY